MFWPQILREPQDNDCHIHKLVRLSPLGNTNWRPQRSVGPVSPSESEAKTCSPDGVLLCTIHLIFIQPLLLVILRLD